MREQSSLRYPRAVVWSVSIATRQHSTLRKSLRTQIRASFSAAPGFRNYPTCSPSSCWIRSTVFCSISGSPRRKSTVPSAGFPFNTTDRSTCGWIRRKANRLPILRRASVAELTEVIRDYGEERYAQSIAKAIVAARTRAPIVRTRQLAEVVGAAAGARTRGDWRQDPATRTFQALRIFANQELTEVRETLPRVVTALATGGRLAVISFHSLEDRIVKRFLTRAAQPYAGDSAVARLAIRASALPGTPLTRIGRARHPSPAEIARNPRSRSAILRVAERTEHPLPVHWPRGYLDDAV